MRPCGDCRLCCKLVAIDELEKPQNRWCTHCNPTGAIGCRIYADRPSECATFKCAYTEGLVTVSPHKSKALLWTQGCPPEGVEILKGLGVLLPVIDGHGVMLTCHEAVPGAHMRGEVAEHLERALRSGYAVLIVPPDLPRFLLYVREGKLRKVEVELTKELDATAWELKQEEAV